MLCYGYLNQSGLKKFFDYLFLKNFAMSLKCLLFPMLHLNASLAINLHLNKIHYKNSFQTNSLWALRKYQSPKHQYPFFQNNQQDNWWNILYIRLIQLFVIFAQYALQHISISFLWRGILELLTNNFLYSQSTFQLRVGEAVRRQSNYSD